MKRICKAFREFVYASVIMLFAIFVIITVFNLIMPIAFACAFKNPIWFLLYIAEPILLFVDVYLCNLFEDLEWWV